MILGEKLGLVFILYSLYISNMCSMSAKYWTVAIFQEMLKESKKIQKMTSGVEEVSGHWALSKDE